ncbi:MULTISPECIES: lysophospholipid acyltransferase family protein [unclassified Rhizobium]|uniref:lysophospholipid acyltransferase family protein n=1 Tax=unclassified Rhizobium TaxID=2613769 RepID=UPI001AD95BFB|nr:MULTISPECIES: lysophospholipid acyltransferase family protein [unclassified Rhizobium]MBO9098444.1 lysophospholipid acyltransferase family protein [Rhizobium sp. L58/93]MBO9168710.1 lysophospholipid acyltransferase family protein [Rhizobium sp. L245/93]MBO9184660.1 lysophospholipid acyltransferase family protein [Rhizobium sp. E27B/91]MBO9132752.1 lysophospholipid acyltransferase family protein [Rhizobium sp. B209b/85]QXZ84840.1 lysophospholipid acyltransferase family protein [Rhizobium sp.
MKLKVLSYANDRDPRLKRWFIRSIEGLSGRDRYARLYDIWRSDIVASGDRVFGKMLDLIDIRMDVRGAWPPVNLPDTPLVIVANHPFGIGDGIAVLALAEQLGRPFRVLINDELLKVPEMSAYSLPISFEETREAMAMNMQTRHEAVRLLKEGVTIIVFPAGGVATAKRGFGLAEDLPWKIFPAKLVQAARASVIPIYFEGQNGRLFHLASKLSLTLRISMLIREFRRLSGSTITSHIGDLITFEKLSEGADRKDLLSRLYSAVFSMAPPKRPVLSRAS